MRSPLRMLAIYLWCLFGAGALVQHEPHTPTKDVRLLDNQPSVLTGKLVDSTWFVPQSDASSEREQLAHASANLVSGIPAAILSEEGGDEKVMWLLLTNPTVLAPYAGKQIKAEGRLLKENLAIIPSTVYVDDAGTWRQVQLAALPEKPPTAETHHTDAQPSAPAEKPRKTDTGHADHPTEHETPASPPEQSTKLERGQADHQTGHSTSEAAEKEGNHDENHHASEAQLRNDHKPDGDHKSGGSHKHNDEHKHWFVLAMPPVHPLLVNFTAGLLPAAVLAEWLGRLLRRRSLTTAAWWMLFFAAMIAPLTALAGWLWFRELEEVDHAQMPIHKWLGLSLAIILPLLAIWRAQIYARDRDPDSTYLIIVTVVLLLMSLQGHLGATMSFGTHDSEAAQGTPHEH